MLRLPASWTWDFWFADDGETYHLFFLKASRALHDPDRRHWRATVGHAVSRDLKTWTEVADALVPADEPAFDDLATWTGSVVRAPGGMWRMFYTGVDRANRGLVQRIGAAWSEDLMTWHRQPDLVLESDHRWYERLTDQTWPDEAWRDPWVFHDPQTNRWHMLITARARQGDPFQRGVVGHAVSEDLDHWKIQEPLSTPGAGFGQLEVIQIEEVEGRIVMLFSCLHTELPAERRRAGQLGGTWCLAIDKRTGPFDVSKARRVCTEALYSGRLIRDRSGKWVMLAFRHVEDDGTFIGEITDPIPITWNRDGSGIQMYGVPDPWRPAETLDQSLEPLTQGQRQ
jgi:beta-fructofuranosidase